MNRRNYFIEKEKPFPSGDADVLNLDEKNTDHMTVRCFKTTRRVDICGAYRLQISNNGTGNITVDGMELAPNLTLGLGANGSGDDLTITGNFSRRIKIRCFGNEVQIWALGDKALTIHEP